jgi:hypothetical protein
VDVAGAIVAFLFGLVTGLVLGRYRADRRAVLATMGLTLFIGLAVWLGDPDHIAGPSLAIGGAGLLLGAVLTPRMRPL